MTQRRVTVMAHFDPGAVLAPHTRRFVREAADLSDEMVLVTTSGVGEEARAWAAEHGVRVFDRENAGHDFMSYKVGLSQVTIDADTEVFMCNDSFVGTTVPLERMWATMATSPAEFWGMTNSMEELRSPDGTRLGPEGGHLQSYFVVFRPGVATSGAFRSFWDDVRVLGDKVSVIDRYEIGLTERLAGAGFAQDAYFKPTLADSWLAQRRSVWWYHPHSFARRPRLTGVRWTAQQMVLKSARLRYNPTLLLADAVFSGRLPMVKTQVLREDPAKLGAEHLLAACEAAFGEVFVGVRDYLARTDAAYEAMRTDLRDAQRDVRAQDGPAQGFELMRYRTPRA